SRDEARRKAVELLDRVRIPSAADRVGDYPHQFSGGMRQRILIAMAIALEPRLLLADEPTTALDVTVQAQILELLDRLRRELDMAVLLITHDLSVVSEVADRVAVMYAGRIAERGSADDLLAQPAHPYTEALLKSVPQAEGVGDDLLTIPGSPPNPERVPPGCAFHPRCSWAIDDCKRTRPALVELRPGHDAACHRSQEVLDAGIR
ncbi:MAG: ABC transporter ATP-binding protein, partial [Nocardioidaceae bacterium]